MTVTLHTGALRFSNGGSLAPPGGRWCNALTPDDDDVLRRTRAPVLDVGCGPGRHVLGLAEQGKIALGIDLTPLAVALARRRGAPVLERSVFARVPGAGRWRTALLLDGNVGIGGDPVGLLRRVGSLLVRDGSLFVELEPEPVPMARTAACLEIDGIAGPWFPWTTLSVADIESVARVSAMRVELVWRSGSRCFAELVKFPLGGEPA